MKYLLALILCFLVSVVIAAAIYSNKAMRPVAVVRKADVAPQVVHATQVATTPQVIAAPPVVEARAAKPEVNRPEELALQAEFSDLNRRFLAATTAYLASTSSSGDVLKQLKNDCTQIGAIEPRWLDDKGEVDAEKKHQAAAIHLAQLTSSDGISKPIREIGARAKTVLKSLTVDDAFRKPLDDLLVKSKDQPALHSQVAGLKKSYEDALKAAVELDRACTAKQAECNHAASDLKKRLADLAPQDRLRYQELPEVRDPAARALAHFGSSRLKYDFILHSAKRLKCVPKSEPASPNNVEILAELTAESRPNPVMNSMSLATFNLEEDGRLQFQWTRDAALPQATSFVSELRGAVLELKSDKTQFFLALYHRFIEPSPVAIQFARDPVATQRIIGKASWIAPASSTPITATSYQVGPVVCHHGETSFTLSDSNLAAAIPILKGHSWTLSRPECIDVPDGSRRWTITLKIDALPREALVDKAKISKELYEVWKRKHHEFSQLRDLLITKSQLENELVKNGEIGRPTRDKVDTLVGLIAAGEPPDSKLIAKARNLPRPLGEVKPDAISPIVWRSHHSNYVKAVVESILPLGITVQAKKQKEINEVNSDIMKEEYAYTDELLKALSGIRTVSVVLCRSIDVPDLQLDDIIVGKPSPVPHGDK